MLALTIVLGLLAVYLAYAYYVQTFSKYGRMINTYPGPKIVPILGNIFDMLTTPVNIFKQFRKYNDTFKTTYRVWNTINGDININNAEDAEILLRSTKHIKKSRFYELVHPWFGTGLLTGTGKKWQHRRKLLTPAFHFNILRKFTETFGEHAQELVEELKKECTKPQTDVSPIMANTTLRALCETAMGTILDPTNKIQQAYINCVHKFGELVVYRLMRPWLDKDFIYNLVPTGRKQKKVVNCLHKFTTGVIKEREANFKDSDVKNLDKEDEIGAPKKKLAMLDLLIAAKKQNSIDDIGIREEVDTVMFAGHDTTSTAISFALMLLANEKEHQEKIVEELKEIFGDSDRPATYEDLQNMPYLDICLKECLRMYPSAPLVARFLEDDLQLSTGVVPAGTTVTLHIYDIHYDERYFPNPKKFDPDRFSQENIKKRHPFAYIPFSAGLRNCIGQKFAMLELKSMVSAVLRNYVLEPVDTPETMNLKLDMTLRNEGPINVIFRPRKLLK